MRFTVPKFIEHEAKIVGPLTFKQFLFIGNAAAICVFLYFNVPFPVFIFYCFVLGGGALALAFLKIGGRSLPTVTSHFLKFNLAPKLYIWKKGKGPMVLLKKKITKPKTTEKKIEELPLKIADGSQLKKLKTHIETKTKK